MECPYRSDKGLSITSRKWNNKTQNHRDDLLTDWRQQHCYPEEISEEIIEYNVGKIELVFFDQKKYQKKLLQYNVGNTELVLKLETIEGAWTLLR